MAGRMVAGCLKACSAPLSANLWTPDNQTGSIPLQPSCANPFERRMSRHEEALHGARSVFGAACAWCLPVGLKACGVECRLGQERLAASHGAGGHRRSQMLV